MADPIDTTDDVEDGAAGKDGGVPERPRLPIISLGITAVFLALGGLLLYFVRAEVGYFFSSKGPEIHLQPTRTEPLPAHPPSNVFAEARINYRELCDFWDTERDPLPPEVSYAFTLQMGMGKRYFLTCVGEGETRPRLWILRPGRARPRAEARGSVRCGSAQEPAELAPGQPSSSSRRPRRSRDACTPRRCDAHAESVRATAGPAGGWPA